MVGCWWLGAFGMRHCVMGSVGAHAQPFELVHCRGKQFVLACVVCRSVGCMLL